MKFHLLALAAGAAMFLCGCTSVSNELIVGRAENMVLDGIPNEKCYETVPAYDLGVTMKAMERRNPIFAKRYGDKTVSPGSVKLLYDKDFLYVGAVLQDDDIVALSNADQQSYCTTGDVFEIFLKPENANYYWEIHITPANRCTVIFYPSRGYHFLKDIVMPPVRPLKNLKYKVAHNGTLNNNKDIDRSWSVEAAIPLKEIAEKGVPFDKNNKFTVLISRYNYSKYQTFCELTSYPKLSRIDFHIHEEYGELKLKD